jgi:competence protein ComEA
VLGLLGPPPQGWVPPPAATAPAELDDQDLPQPAPAAVRVGRLDPGRRGAAALVVAALLAALVAGGVVLHGRPQEVVVPEVVATGTPLPGAPAAPTEPPTEVVVAVAGKVVRPGLVRLPAGSRVDDAVRAAGGVVAGADPGLLNLARTLVDGEQVLVGVDPPPGSVPAAAPGGAGAPDGPLDLNTAGAAELDALPGIGPVLAQRIVDWRTEHGRFASVEQLREVTGIGESKYADLVDEVAVR